jgi:hypothetical protein
VAGTLMAVWLISAGGFGAEAAVAWVRMAHPAGMPAAHVRLLQDHEARARRRLGGDGMSRSFSERQFSSPPSPSAASLVFRSAVRGDSDEKDGPAGPADYLKAAPAPASESCLGGSGGAGGGALAAAAGGGALCRSGSGGAGGRAAGAAGGRGGARLPRSSSAPRMCGGAGGTSPCGSSV